MNEMYVSLISTRRSTGTVRRSVHVVAVAHDGPQRTIERFCGQLADTFQEGWSLNAMQITSFEYKAFQLQQEEAGASL